MKRLDIDYTKHMAFPKSTGKALRARIREKYSYADSLRIINAMDRKYEEFLRDIPYCGGKHNGMIWQLYEAVACFAYYEVLPEKESMEEFSETCAKAFANDIDTKKLPKAMTIDSKGFTSFIKFFIRAAEKIMNKPLETGKWEDGWRIEMDEDCEEGIRVALIGCPIYNFAVKHGYTELMPAMCNCDFPGMKFLNAGLIRPRTISNGDDRCDNWYVSFDSLTYKQHPAELNEKGLLISKDWK